MRNVAAVHRFGVIPSLLYTLGPRPMTSSSILLTAVFTQTILLPR